MVFIFRAGSSVLCFFLLNCSFISIIFYWHTYQFSEPQTYCDHLLLYWNQFAPAPSRCTGGQDMLRQFAEFLFLGQILGIQVGRHKVVQKVGDPREEHWVVCHPADDGSSRYDALEYPRFFGLPNKRTPAVTVAGRSVIVTRAQDVLGNSGVVLVVAGFGGHGFGSKLLQARGHCRAVGCIHRCRQWKGQLKYCRIASTNQNVT